jgi:hypothetical protein
VSLFGDRQDFELFRVMSRELVNSIVEQAIGYYKISLKGTSSNIYGESSDKSYNDPVKLNCLITRGDQVISSNEFGQDMTRQSSFAFLKDDLVDSNLLAEVGDIIFWNGDYYEVDTVRENQLFFGNDNAYNNVEEYHNKYGSSVSIICDAHLTRVDKLGIEQARF